MSSVLVHQADCLEILRGMADNSVHSIVTDPPYGLSFMGKRWDYDVPSVEIWSECLRMLKPGGHLLAFAGTRTQHRMAVRIEDAGFEIRDMIAWVYGSGFPKSRNLDGDWQGWGTALKPALEPITVARKPLVGTVAANVLEFGTGALNIDGCRVDGESTRRTNTAEMGFHGGNLASEYQTGSDAGRWPANLIHDGSDEVVAAFPQAPGQQGPISSSAPSEKTSKVYGRMSREGETSADSENKGAVGFKMKPGARRLDEGSAARFFYCAKASGDDREGGLPDGNPHPTVKPVDLMRYLCRLVTPPGGVVLDPFMGSGTTGVAAVLEGFGFVGVEREAQYHAVAVKRLDYAKALRLSGADVLKPAADRDPHTVDLFSEA